MSPSPSAAICRITDGEVRAQDLRVGEARALGEVLLGVEADADAVGGAPAAALALVGRGLRDRLDRQPLDLQPRAVAADARGARDRRRSGCPGTVSDVSATLVASTTRRSACGWKTRCCSALDRRAYSGRSSTPSPQPAAQRVGGVADLALAAEEHEHVAAAARAAARRPRRRSRRPGRASSSVERPVADLDRVRAAGDLDDRRVAEVRGEALGVDRRRGDDQLQVGPPRQDPLAGSRAGSRC